LRIYLKYYKKAEGHSMKVSTEIASISCRVGREKAIQYVAEAGFDAFDLSMSSLISYTTDWKMIANRDDILAGDQYLKYIRQLKRVADDNGIPCNQSHAPFPSMDPIAHNFLKRAIECTAEMGGKICVIHPDNNRSPEENAQMYIELLPFAKDHGVKIATENMWNWNHAENHAAPAACSHHDNFLAHMEAVNDPYFVACVDIGHAEMEGLNTSAPQMIRTLGKHVQALHIHDVDKHNDNHQIPFSLNVDFEAVVQALKDINYSGYFTLESVCYLRENPDWDTFDCVCTLQKSVRRLANMFETL